MDEATKDVALAWKSLQKAKAVLQRIENKFYHQTWSCAKSQAARRKLWHEKSFDGKRYRDETALHEKKSNESPRACRRRNCAALCPAGSQPCFHGSPAPSPSPAMAPLASGGRPPTAPCSPAGMEAAPGEGIAGTEPPAQSLCKPRREDLGERMDSRGDAVQKEKCRCSLHHPSHSPVGSSQFSAPTAALLPAHCLPSASSTRQQKLEELRKKSPLKKLEQLKKKIQEQKLNQQAASQEQRALTASCAQEPLWDKPLRRKVCRMPAPAAHHRGFSSVNSGSALLSPDEEHRMPDRKSAIPGQWRNYKKAPKISDQRMSSSARRIQARSQRQHSPEPSALERTAAGKGTKLPGTSAWREGQKLARKLLGPPPAFPKRRSTAEEQTTGNTYETERGFAATPATEKSSREKRKRNEPVGKSPEFKSCTVPHHGPVGRSSSAPTKDTKEILRDLHLQSQYHDEHRHSRIPEDIAKGMVEFLQQYPEIHSHSPELQDMTPSAFSGEKIRALLIKAGAKPSSSGDCSRDKSTSARRWRGSSSPAQKGSEKGNLKHPSKKRVNIKKSHPYSHEVVQEFIFRKNEERKKKEREEKKSLMQAMEMRNKRLQEVYRKQREAIGRKTCSDHTCKLIRETAAAKESPRCALEQEQTSGAVLERSFMARVDKTSHALLNKDHRDRNQLLETVPSLKREPLPAAGLLGSESWFPSPLKCQDLRDRSHPALYTPPLSFTLPQKDAKLGFKDSTSGLSPYRNKWDRVKAIHNLSKELAEKIEMATKRLNAMSSAKDSADKMSAGTTWDLFKESSVPEPETSKNEQDRTMTLQMLLGPPDPDELCLSSDREFHGLGRISLTDSTEGATDLDREKKITTLSGGSVVSKELPWIPCSIRQRHLSVGDTMSSTMKGFPVHKGSEVDMSLLHEKPITSPASPSHGFLARSPQREPTAQRNQYRCETMSELQKQEEIAGWWPTESLRTPSSPRLQPVAVPTPGAGTQDGLERDLGEGDPSYAELKEKHRSHLDNLRQTSLLLAHKLKAHQLQQKQQLTALSEKAKLEVQESQRFLSDLLQNNLKLCRSSKGIYSSVPKWDHAEQMWTKYWTEGDNAAGSNEEMHSMKQFPLNMERDHGPVDPKTVGQRKSLGGRGSYGSTLQEGSPLTEDTESLHSHQALHLLSPLVDLPHGETCVADGSGESSDQASLDSQWSEVGWHYGSSSTFCRFSLAMAEQCLRGEELRARHQAALLKLRRKALWAKARAELAWLGHQKRCLESLQDSKGASAMAEKQRKIITELKQEQVEIKHLQNIYRAAHQERKLLLKQQREILMMRRSTAKLQEELHHWTGKEKLTRSPAVEEEIKLKTRQISSPMLDSSLAESTEPLERPDMPGDKNNHVQLKNKQSKKYDGFSTENKKTLVQYQEQTEESPGLEQSLGAQGPDVSGTETKRVRDASSQTTGLVLMIKDNIHTGDDTALSENHSLLRGEKAYREQRSCRTSREEQDLCSPSQSLQDETRKKDLSSDDEDGEKRSASISNEATVMKTQLRKGSSLAEQRVSTDSERKSQIMNIDEEAPSEIPFSEDVPLEVEVSASCEIHQVDGSQSLKPLDHNSQEASGGETHLKAFYKGLASTESLSKSNNFSPSWESAKSDCSLPEFQKVSAVWINISESSISDLELGMQNGEDTDASIPEEFVYDHNAAFPNTSKGTPIAISIGRETLCSDKHEHGVPKDDSSTEISSGSQNFQKYPGEASDHGCTGHLLSFLLTDKANSPKTKPLDSSQFDEPAKGMDKPHLEASENSKNAAASSLCSDDICLLKIYEQHNLSSTTSKLKRNDRINCLLGDRSRELKLFPSMDSLKHLDLATSQLNSTVSFPSDKGIANDKLVACLSSRNASEQNNQAQLLNERVTSSKFSKTVSLPLSTQGISEEVHTETNSFESLQRVAPANHKNTKTDSKAIKELEKGQFSSLSSKKQMFQSENCSSRSGDDTIFISDEGLPLPDEDTLSEILSPVDEVLSYGSADLPSSNKKDLSFPSEDLPPPPLGVDAMKNDDSSTSVDDFPSPPEQTTVSETRQCMNEDISLKMDALPQLTDNIVPEESLNQEPTDIFPTWEGTLSEQSLTKEDISFAKKDSSEYQEGEHETPLQCSELLSVSNSVSSSQASKNPDSMMKQCKTYLTLPIAEEDSGDPLSSFETGDRVLVKQTQSGTLMFKGQTRFASGHWAGVALDKAEGDHTGTYKGVKYFECAQHCGIFVRPDEISHLLEANTSGSSSTGDEDSDSFYDDESFKRGCKYPEVGEQGAGITEQKAEDTKNTGGSEVPENQSRLHVALLSGKGQKFPRSDHCKHDEYLHQNNVMCLRPDKEKTELTQTKQGMIANVLLKKNKTSYTDGVKTSKNVCCLVEDQKRNKLTDDITTELSKKLLFDTLIAFSETAQHKYKNAFEKDAMNYVKGLRQEDNQKQFFIKENPVASLLGQSAKVSDVFLHDFNVLSIHDCHTVAEKIVAKFVDDAVKEYKKIKRKHGEKADKIFPSSSETSPSTLPFLIKILDAGIFGSSKDFDQPNSDERTLDKQTQKQYLHKLDRWHSAPWKKNVEVPLVVPHHSSYVKKLSAYAVEELWTPENIYSNFTRTSVPKHFECNDFPEHDLETESKRMYNQLIFDLTRELLRAEYQETTNTFPWLKENLGSCCSRCHCGRMDVSEVKKLVQGEIMKIMNLEKNDLDMKRKFLNMTKYGNCDRDRVDLILIQELFKEESQWTYYDDDELTVKMSMAEDIFDSLILDTVRVLNKIYLRKACD